MGVNAGEMPHPHSGIGSEDPVVAHRAEVAERCLLYVAASRARDALYVTSFGTPSPFLVAMGPPPRVAPPPQQTQRPPPKSSPADENNVPVANEKAAAELGVSGELGMSLDLVDLPTRMANWTYNKGITTLEELARLHPRDLLSERNLGRKSIAETRAVLEALLRCTWEEAAGENSPQEGAPTATEAFLSKDWDAVRRNLPLTLVTTNLVEIDLPVRMQNYAKREGLRTVADLATRSKSELLGAKNLGRASIPAMVEAIQTHIGRVEDVRRKTEAGFFESWKGILQDQDAVRRMVFTRRAGLGGASETLKSIGETLGVSRERVRQIENDVAADLKRERFWLNEVRRRIEAVLEDDAAPLDQLGVDPWWAGVAMLPAALDYFGEALLDSDVRVIEIDERSYLVRCTPAAFDAAWEALRKEASTVRIPGPLDTFRLLVEKFVANVGRFLGGVLFERLREILHIEESGGQARVVGFGTTRPAAILALLRASTNPMRVEDVIERLERGHMPEEVLFFDSGLIGLEQHFPDFELWREKLVPKAIEVMQQESPERQWLANEILDEIRESTELPDSLNHWRLASLLRRSGRVRYLGRNRFGLLESPEERGRIHYHDELTRILRERGEPMLREDLIAELRRKMTATPSTVAMFLGRPPFVACDSDRVGLYDRDLPGGAEAMAEGLEHVARVLERRERGLGAAKVKTEISRLSQTHASWSQEMCLSVLRGDPRFRLSQSGGVGLSQWEAVRVPSRAEIVRKCLEEAEGRVTVEAVQRRIEAYYGAAPERFAISAIANRFGAVLRGDWLERVAS